METEALVVGGTLTQVLPPSVLNCHSYERHVVQKARHVVLAAQRTFRIPEK
jgi:hypothetical protein